MVFVRHLQGERVAYVACEPHVEPCAVEDVVDERGGRGLAVGACDTNHLGMGVARGELYLGDDGRALCLQLLDKRCSERDTRALHYLIGIENLLGSMPAVFPRDAVLVEHGAVGEFDFPHIANEHLVAFLFAQNRGTRARLSGT